jgi:hypothetical protein
VTIQNLLICLCLIVFTAGCTSTRYAWNGYNDKLYQHYKNPAEYDEFVEHLKEVIEVGEESGKVPPGIYAEYGFALYEKGKFPEAANYFKLESDKWPESRVLMAKMIKNAQTRGKQGKQPNQTSDSIKSELPKPIISEVIGGAK